MSMLTVRRAVAGGRQRVFPAAIATWLLPPVRACASLPELAVAPPAPPAAQRSEGPPRTRLQLPAITSAATADHDIAQLWQRVQATRRHQPWPWFSAAEVAEVQPALQVWTSPAAVAGLSPNALLRLCHVVSACWRSIPRAERRAVVGGGMQAVVVQELVYRLHDMVLAAPSSSVAGFEGAAVAAPATAASAALWFECVAAVLGVWAPTADYAVTLRSRLQEHTLASDVAAAAAAGAAARRGSAPSDAGTQPLDDRRLLHAPPSVVVLESIVGMVQPAVGAALAAYSALLQRDGVPWPPPGEALSDEDTSSNNVTDVSAATITTTVDRTSTTSSAPPRPPQASFALRHLLPAIEVFGRLASGVNSAESATGGHATDAAWYNRGREAVMHILQHDPVVKQWGHATAGTAPLAPLGSTRQQRRPQSSLQAARAAAAAASAMGATGGGRSAVGRPPRPLPPLPSPRMRLLCVSALMEALMPVYGGRHEHASGKDGARAGTSAALEAVDAAWLAATSGGGLAAQPDVPSQLYLMATAVSLHSTWGASCPYVFAAMQPHLDAVGRSLRREVRSLVELAATVAGDRGASGRVVSTPAFAAVEAPPDAQRSTLGSIVVAAAVESLPARRRRLLQLMAVATKIDLGMQKVDIACDSLRSMLMQVALQLLRVDRLQPSPEATVVDERAALSTQPHEAAAAASSPPEASCSVRQPAAAVPRAVRLGMSVLAPVAVLGLPAPLSHVDASAFVHGVARARDEHFRSSLAELPLPSAASPCAGDLQTLCENDDIRAAAMLLSALAHAHVLLPLGSNPQLLVAAPHAQRLVAHAVLPFASVSPRTLQSWVAVDAIGWLAWRLHAWHLASIAGSVASSGAVPVTLPPVCVELSLAAAQRVLRPDPALVHALQSHGARATNANEYDNSAESVPPESRRAMDDAWEPRVARAVRNLCLREGLPVPVTCHGLQSIGMTLDVAWPHQRVALMLDGASRFLPPSLADQVRETMRQARKGVSDPRLWPLAPVRFVSQSPGILAGKALLPRQRLAQAAAQALGWRVYRLSVHDYAADTGLQTALESHGLLDALRSSCPT